LGWWQEEGEKKKEGRGLFSPNEYKTESEISGIDLPSPPLPLPTPFCTQEGQRMKNGKWQMRWSL